MGIKCAEDPFNMGTFFDIRPPSFWIHFQTPNTHIRAFCTGVVPPGSVFIIVLCMAFLKCLYVMICQMKIKTTTVLNCLWQNGNMVLQGIFTALPFTVRTFNYKLSAEREVGTQPPHSTWVYVRISVRKSMK